MTSIWSSDLHLNDVPRDSYRWEILPWLEKEATSRGVDFVGLAGDLTDAKDRHAASLVNRVADFLATSKVRWLIVTGNHDFIDPLTPFFRFLGHLPNVQWIVGPYVTQLPVDDRSCKTLLLPATRDWETEWASHLGGVYDYIFMHGTFAGTKSENGFELPGIERTFFADTTFGRLYAGDIHTPGLIEEGMEYIGAPYRVHFGDTYTPRAIYLGKQSCNMHPPMRSRHVVVVRGPQDLEKFEEVAEGDQVKLRVRLKRSEFPDWRKIRSEIVVGAESLGWEICGIELLAMSPVRRRLQEGPQENQQLRKTPGEHLREYATAQKWKESVIEYGLSLLGGTDANTRPHKN